ncbi:MAG: M36 family metallopeptidase, partial [Bacteroidia bacterium]|nr:M36 family metallopeptidase [Bacteroidia bacterium]
GNNVHAYRDADDNGSPSQAEPDGTDDLIFDFLHDKDAEPDASIEADVTNLFYINNMMHDISYLFGFDEVAGNFQSNNYGNGGNQGDHVRAEAQDGANILDTDHTNNANFTPVPDGFNGRIQMYYWGQAQGATNITEPPELAGPLEVNVPNATDWGFIYSQQFSQLDIEEKMVLVDDGTVGNPARGCNPLVNGNEINGHIAMIDRGVCEFGTKTLNAQEAGAVAVVICNVPGVDGGDGDEFVSMGGGADGINVTIPALFARFSDCQRIKASINAGNDVVLKIKEIENAGPSYYSSSFDNGVVAHEYAHGISSRLTGGPSTTGCLPRFDDNGDGNFERGEQMGEGWSDFFALIATVEPGDEGTDSRGIGNYVQGSTVQSRGIRRFPYSTDMSVNPQTMNDIVNGGSIYATGEVWTDALWDMYWAFVDLYGWDADWTNTESGNFKAVQLVMDGMKFQPCAPGFIDGRDAILLADQVNYDGENKCLIWDVFARRGIGINAEQGSTLTQTDNIENFESLPTCIAELKIKKEISTTLTPGEQTEVVLSFANHRPEDMTNVRITDELPANAEFVSHNSNYVVDVVDGMVIFTIGDMATLVEDTIRYTIQSDASVKSAILYSDNNEDPAAQNNNWDREIIEGTNFWQINGIEEFSYSGYNSWYILEQDGITKSDLIYKKLTVEGDNPVLRFWHLYNTTPSVNAGYVELSRDGVIWEDAKRLFIRNRYPSPINYGTFAIPALEGFSGNSNGFEDSFIDLNDYKGEDISIRFKFGTDETGNFFAPDNGWFVDDIDLIDLIEYNTEACITSDTDSGCSGIKTSFVEASLISSSEEVEVKGLEWQLYPNPAGKFVNLEVFSDQSFDTKIIISSGHGLKIREVSTRIQPNSNMIRLDTSGFPAGLYTVQLLNGNKLMTRKLIIY